MEVLATVTERDDVANSRVDAYLAGIKEI